MTSRPSTTTIVVVQTTNLLLVVVKPQTAAVWKKKKRKTTPNGRFLVLACLSTMTGEEEVIMILIKVVYERWSGAALSA
jgi:3-deoxy-D-manno-octulosonic-acid transferase